MERLKENIQYLFLVTAILMFVSACSSTPVTGEAPADAVCSAIVDTKCVRCHYKTRICDALGTKSIRQWKKSIKFMVKQGAVLTEEEQNTVLACLSSMPEGSNIVCK